MNGNRDAWRAAARRCAIAGALVAILQPAARADTERYTVITGGKNVGTLVAETTAGQVRVNYDVKNNGRGPTITETIHVEPDGRPSAWSIAGTTTFGSKVSERFQRKASHAEWLDSTGKGESNEAEPAGGQASPPEPRIYVAQSASPWSDGLYARALLKSAGMRLGAMPDGTLTLTRGESFVVGAAGAAAGAATGGGASRGAAGGAALHGVAAGGALRVTRYELSGIQLIPETLLLDDREALFAVVDPATVIVRAGYEGEEQRLRGLAADWSTARFVNLEHEVAHRYPGAVRIRNVRLFDPRTSALTQPVSVLVAGRDIAAIESLASPATPGEVAIDGAGGSLIPGMVDMHAHLQQDEALLDVLAGVTTVRDMGNDNAVLEALTARIETGQIGGPRVIRSGFIEGRSPYSANNGILVGSEAEALDAVRWYGARGFWQIKIYNSMNPAWVPAMADEAHRLGMRVAGHIPAFSTTDRMIDAGYDEITHINQFMLGWVIGPDEDTRTLFRLTALKRFGGIDLQSDKVQRTIRSMVDRHIAIDPTLGIHEMLTQNRDGEIPPGAVDYFSHMPIGWRRDALKALIDTGAPGDDQAYRAAFDKILATTRLLHDRGVFIVFGTDTGGSFTFHRELELYQRAGMTPAEILKRAGFDAMRYLGIDQRLGSIEKGKLADFFLVPGDPIQDLKAIKRVSLVVKDGAFYYPAEVYPKFGIEPFAPPPEVVLPAP
jgi:imidazolonepropionase-like amidohydrolase